MAAQVASGLSAAAAGWSWWAPDIGGFQGDPTVSWSGNIDEDPYRELYVRWLQWGTFLPFMRNVSLTDLLLIDPALHADHSHSTAPERATLKAPTPATMNPGHTAKAICPS